MKTKKSTDKTVQFNDLNRICRRLRKQNLQTVLCHGCFDFLHLGHLRHFKEAKTQGDVLIVTLTEDRYVNKGPGRPFYNVHDRAEMLAALEIVDFVCINPWPTAAETIETLQPDVFVKGKEYRTGTARQDARFRRELLALSNAGGRIHFTDDITLSSSRILEDLTETIQESISSVPASVSSAKRTKKQPVA